ncbi:MAG TPA: DUF4087 domain-containing protein [Pyrinomonadaceae bacterium]|jgi:hypothetical protein
MRKFFFYALILFLFSLSILSCRSARQSEISSNASNAAPQNSPKETPQPKAEAAQAAPEKANAGEPKKSPSDAAPQTSSEAKFENRCGWFVNPTPANASLEDKDGEWIIGVQGGYQAGGDYPEFDDKDWVKTNVNYGYGCACMRVKVDFKTRRVLEIASATTKPLAACRKDPALKEPR